MLSGKNILFIGVKFYHYHEAIVEKLSSAFNARVTFYPERDTSILYGVVNRMFPNQLEKYQELYYRKLIKLISKDRFDYFLVIRGFRMPLWFVKKIKENNPDIKTIYYQWDSDAGSQFLGLDKKYDIIEEFENRFSFDYRDVENSQLLKLRPLFYTDEIKLLKRNDEQVIKYDLFYFGSYLPERYKGLINFIKYAEKNNYVIKAYFFMPLRYYIIERLKGVKIDRNLIKTKPMSRRNYLALLEKSRCVVDVSNHRQTGMAMRVVESFGASKKLITTNTWILKEKAFDSSQIQIVDIDKIEISENFLSVPIDKDYSNEFSLEQWLRDIFTFK